MAISDFISFQPALEKFKIDGPLLKFIESFSDWLLEAGFHRKVARRHLTNIAHFNYFLSINDVNHLPLLKKEIQIFLYEHIPICNCKWWGQIRDSIKVRESIYRFEKYLLEFQNIKIKGERIYYNNIYMRFLEWLKFKRNLSEKTIGCHLNYINKFLQWWYLETSGKEIDKIDAKKIELYLLTVCIKIKPSIKKHIQSTLRNFFLFCYEEKLIKKPLYYSVPKIKKYKFSALPKAIDDNSVISIIEKIDRSTNYGKRLYAIIRLLFEYGIRGCQIRCLKFDDIDWNNETINFSAQKGGKDSSFPLTKEVGNAIIDYVKNVRPKSNYKEIFLTLQAPFTPIKAQNLSHILKKAIENAGIKLSHYGSHCFRHGFVSRLLKKGISYKNIADLIGHRYIGSTFIYTKIDKDALAEVALELPEVLQ
jgi:site-specific recombinase XerD